MDLYKAHGTGNDFVVLPDPEGRIDLAAASVVALCDRRFGIGADGVLRLAPSDQADVFMDYRNGGDGDPVEMCGNGVRVVARHLLDHGWTSGDTIRVDTRAGIRTATINHGSDGAFDSVTVDMGPPGFDLGSLPFRGGDVDGDGWHHLDVDGDDVALLPVSMGNPHAVLLCDDPAQAPVTTLGPRLEHDDAFPNGTNVEFVAVRDDHTLDLRVWERGVGETKACGTGVCGAVAALTAHGRLAPDSEVTVNVPGGTLVVSWSGGDDPVLLTGPAEEVARIELDDDWAARHGLADLMTATA